VSKRVLSRNHKPGGLGLIWDGVAQKNCK